MDYSIMVKSVEFTKEFQGMSYDEYVIGAPDNTMFVVANVVIANTSDEPIIPEERVLNPKLATKIAHRLRSPAHEFAPETRPSCVSRDHDAADSRDRGTIGA
ncbi:hypothetical protein [Pseudoglutamicibacter cumminsii]|uniref:hypothetical protein n=1 Tax=Pseudoglutamicibacter cumminsii TaxID=156979 RepID=UPI00195B2D00|nr:hypothetical protein [Pseudoglutamicibacter cumminsii]MBM7795315.1 hypothetical protein [Pseudoglutamicibacter cumminsii]